MEGTAPPRCSRLAGRCEAAAVGGSIGTLFCRRRRCPPHCVVPDMRVMVYGGNGASSMLGVRRQAGGRRRPPHVAHAVFTVADTLAVSTFAELAVPEGVVGRRIMYS